MHFSCVNCISRSRMYDFFYTLGVPWTMVLRFFPFLRFWSHVYQSCVFRFRVSVAPQRERKRRAMRANSKATELCRDGGLHQEIAVELVSHYRIAPRKILSPVDNLPVKIRPARTSGRGEHFLVGHSITWKLFYVAGDI